MSLWTVILLLALTPGKTVFVASDQSQGQDNPRGYPCVRRLNQLYCPSPGKNYPSDIFKRPQITTNKTFSMFHTEVFIEDLFDEEQSFSSSNMTWSERRKRSKREEDIKLRIRRQEKRDMMDVYIDENKSLIKRMFGEFAPSHDHQDFSTFDGTSLDKHKRIKRTSYDTNYHENRMDTCESIVEIVTPYWASNSGGKIRAIVNTQHLQQAIQQEVCQSVRTKRCKDDCSCEQKYKWHRLLAYDPDDDCRGIFMDWFLFPSCCVCRCSTNPLHV